METAFHSVSILVAMSLKSEGRLVPELLGVLTAFNEKHSSFDNVFLPQIIKG